MKMSVAFHTEQIHKHRTKTHTIDVHFNMNIFREEVAPKDKRTVFQFTNLVEILT